MKQDERLIFRGAADLRNIKLQGAPHKGKAAKLVGGVSAACKRKAHSACTKLDCECGCHKAIH
jgi:hypothetical protein